MKTGIIAVDFDGTCCLANFPEVGKDIGAQYVLQELVRNGNKIILFTMRGKATYDWNHEPLKNNVLQDAIDWFGRHNIPLWGVNVNPQQEQDKWTDSPKPFANVIIDDYNVCAPFRYVVSHQSILIRITLKILDWKEIASWLALQGYLTGEQKHNCIEKIEEDISKL